MSIKNAWNPNKLIRILCERDRYRGLSLHIFNHRNDLNKLAGDPITKFIAFILITLIGKNTPAWQCNISTQRCGKLVRQSGGKLQFFLAWLCFITETLFFFSFLKQSEIKQIFSKTEYVKYNIYVNKKYKMHIYYIGCMAII